MRSLQLQDTFAVARIIKKANLKEVIKDATKNSKIMSAINSKEEQSKEVTDDEIMETGIDMIFTIIENVSDEKVEKDIYKLLASIFEKKENDIRTMAPGDFIKNIKELLKENDIVTFFKSATQLM